MGSFNGQTRLGFYIKDRPICYSAVICSSVNSWVIWGTDMTDSKPKEPREFWEAVLHTLDEIAKLKEGATLMSSWYNEIMSKVLKLLSRYSVGKNSSVRELPDQYDPQLKTLIQQKELSSESLLTEIKKQKITRQFASFKVTHVPVADVQILLDALEYAKEQYADGVYDLPKQAEQALKEYYEARS